MKTSQEVMLIERPSAALLKTSTLEGSPVCAEAGEMFDYKAFNDILKDRRMNGAALAQKAGFAVEMLEKYQKGLQIPSLTLIKGMAEALNCRVTDLIDLSANRSDAKKPKSHPSHVTFELLRNSTDFVLKSLQTLEFNDKIHSKFACIEMYAGVELLLKATLAQEHWTFIIAKGVSASVKAFYAGTFQTVDYSTSLARLGEICEIEIDESDLKSFNMLRLLRNRFIHFSEDSDNDLVHTIVIGAWRSILNFYRTLFPRHYNNSQWWLTLYKAAAKQPFAQIAADGYTASLYAEMRKQCVFTWTCFNCENRTCVFDHEQIHCGICDLDYEPSDYARRYYSEFEDDVSVHDCAECGLESVVPLEKRLAERLINMDFQQHPDYLAHEAKGTFSGATFCMNCFDVAGECMRAGTYASDVDYDYDNFRYEAPTDEELVWIREGHEHDIPKDKLYGGGVFQVPDQEFANESLL